MVPPTCFPSTSPCVEVLYGWHIRPGEVLCSFHDPLQSFAVVVLAISIPGGDAARPDTLDGALVKVAEYPGV